MLNAPVSERRTGLFYYIRTDVMKSSPLLMLLFATFAGTLGAQVTTGQGAAPGVPGAVTVSGKVINEGTQAPVPYSTVRLEPIGRDRFTERNGTFSYFSIPPGEYRLQVRMLGYIPIDSAITVEPNVPLSVTIMMTRIPTSLGEVQVTAPPRLCIFPNEAGFVDDPELATVLDEARKNAQREQLLRRTYPFEYRLAQSHETYDPASSRSSRQYDTVTFRSDDSWRYRRGRVVSEDHSRLFGEIRLMRLPTVADLADKTFLTSHCFKYSGIVDEDGRPAHRLDFLSDSTLKAPDVEGSIFLDSATYLIRRAQFRLTRGESLKPAILGLQVTTTYREILPNVALFDEIRSVQPVATPSSRPGGLREFREVQKLLGYRFLYGGPPGTEGHKWIAATAMSAGSESGRGNGVSQGKYGPPP